MALTIQTPGGTLRIARFKSGEFHVTLSTPIMSWDGVVPRAKFLRALHRAGRIHDRVVAFVYADRPLMRRNRRVR